MAPLAADPRQLLVVLNLARRKALYQLATDITAYMRLQLELKGNQDHSQRTPLQGQGRNHGSKDAPLLSTADGASETESASQQPPPSSPELARLRRAALAHFDEWRKETLSELREVVSAQEDSKITDARKQRADRLARSGTVDPFEKGDGSLISFDDDGPGKEAKDNDSDHVRFLQSVYKPVPTRLTTIPLEDRAEALSCVLLLLLSAGKYSAYSRALVVYLTSSLELPLSVLTKEETEIATTLLESSAEAEKQMSADGEAQKRKQEGQAGRFWKVGLASVAGAAVIGITGGLAAPVVAGALGGLMGSVGLGGVASFLGIFWMNGALVGTLFGAFGAKMTGEMMDKYAREVEDFRFLPLREPQEPPGNQASPEAAQAAARRLRLTIGVNGWLTSPDDIERPWRALSDETEAFALRFEVESLLELGKSLDGLVSSYAWKVAKVEIIKRTALATLWAALWPIHMLRMASNVDNPFGRARNRSEKAGRILADALINRVQGERPVTLIGYSLGARVIYACLRSLAERRAFGLVDTVVFIGAPVPSNESHWLEMRSVVSGKMYNVFSENDFILAFMYRAASVQLGVAGLQAIPDIEGVENLDLSEGVSGHLRYPDLIAQILTRCGFPNIRGGEGPIEKDKDDIAIEAQAREEGGDTLIELDDLPAEDMPAPALPTRPSTRPETGPSASNVRGNTRKVVNRTPSETLTRDLDPLSKLSLEGDVKPLSRPARQPRELAGGSKSQSDLGAAKALESPSVKPKEPSGTQNVSEGKRPALPDGKTAPPALVSSFDGYRHREDDSEDDDEGGIKMVDNDDDMVTYDAPLPMED